MQDLHPGNERWAIGAHGRHILFPSEAALACLDCVADDGLGDAARGVRDSTLPLGSLCRNTSLEVARNVEGLIVLASRDRAD